MSPAGEPEPDASWPSGPWKGYWTEPQRPCFPFRNRMDLDLRFHDGRIDGNGSDRVGIFSISGTFDVQEARCSFRKSYAGHDVHYDGRNDGTGIYGGWKLASFPGGADSGGFHIWPAGASEESSARTETEARNATRKAILRRAPSPPVSGSPLRAP